MSMQPKRLFTRIMMISMSNSRQISNYFFDKCSWEKIVAEYHKSNVSRYFFSRDWREEETEILIACIFGWLKLYSWNEATDKTENITTVGALNILLSLKILFTFVEKAEIKWNAIGNIQFTFNYFKFFISWVIHKFFSFSPQTSRFCRENACIVSSKCSLEVQKHKSTLKPLHLESTSKFFYREKGKSEREMIRF